jgi:hypothetical protein
VPPVGLEQPLDIARGGDAGGERAFAGENGGGKVSHGSGGIVPLPAE